MCQSPAPPQQPFPWSPRTACAFHTQLDTHTLARAHRHANKVTNSHPSAPRTRICARSDVRLSPTGHAATPGGASVASILNSRAARAASWGAGLEEDRGRESYESGARGGGAFSIGCGCRNARVCARTWGRRDALERERVCAGKKSCVTRERRFSCFIHHLPHAAAAPSSSPTNALSTDSLVVNSCTRAPPTDPDASRRSRRAASLAK